MYSIVGTSPYFRVFQGLVGEIMVQPDIYNIYIYTHSVFPINVYVKVCIFSSYSFSKDVFLPISILELFVHSLQQPRHRIQLPRSLAKLKPFFAAALLVRSAMGFFRVTFFGMVKCPYENGK